jgi:cation diffusion facilitator family transporter
VILYYGDKLESIALEADGLHILIDAYTSAVVLIAMAVIWITNIKILDPIITIGIAFFMIYFSYRIFTKSFKPLMDSSLSSEEENRIIQTLKVGSNGLLGFRELRTRRAGSDRYVEVDLMFRSDMSLDDVHKICNQIETDLAEQLPSINVLLHVEPYPRLKLIGSLRKKPGLEDS